MIAELRRRIDSRRDELDQRRAEYEAVTGRINTLADEAGVTRRNGDPQAVLRDLQAVLAEHQQVIQRRVELSRRNRSLRRRQARYEQNLIKHRRRRAGLLADAGATDENEFQLVAAQVRRARQLRQQHDELTQQINSAINGRLDAADVAREIDGHSHTELDEAQLAVAEQIDSSRARLSELHVRRGELSQRMKSLAEDRRPAEARLQLGCVEEQLRVAVRHWQVLALTGQLLDSIRELYETERQPETLREASTYLEQLTEGQYTRVWTPMTEDVLRVDNADGQSLPLEVLSRGTREAVFLSLRLALVSAYAKRGAVLPLVLDDVLVNLDAARAKAAAKVLRDFANDDRQLLLFTCHEHIRKMFKSLRVEIRQLPDHAELAAAADDEIADEEEVLIDEEELEDEIADEEEAEDAEYELEEEDDESDDVDVEEEDVEESLEDAVEDEVEEVVEPAAEEQPSEDWDFPESLWEEKSEEAA